MSDTITIPTSEYHALQVVAACVRQNYLAFFGLDGWGEFSTNKLDAAIEALDA